MGIQHTQLNVAGVQFHPEAILTRHGHRLLANFLELTSTPSTGADLVASSALENSRADCHYPINEH
jgi:GMP synthase-like glutamine amidotransferase